MPKIVAGEVKRDKQSDKFIGFMEKLKAKEFFGNEESKREFIKNLEFDQFENLFFASNAMLRDIPVSKRAMDGTDVALRPVETSSFSSVFAKPETQYPPRHEDKKELLNELFLAAKEMNEEDVPMEDIALMISVAINAVHPFMDGNGRMSRLIYFLLTEDCNGAEEQMTQLKKVLGYKGRLLINNDPSEATKAINEYYSGLLCQDR